MTARLIDILGECFAGAVILWAIVVLPTRRGNSICGLPHDPCHR